jgi:hypothetical protein
VGATLTLEPDAFQAAKAKAAHEKVSLGKAVSALILQAIRESSVDQRSSTVFRSKGGIYTAFEAEAALDDE